MNKTPLQQSPFILDIKPINHILAKLMSLKT